MNETLEAERKKRRAKRKRRKRAKAFFMTLGILIVAAGAFLITVKICKPDFDFTAWIPQAAVSYIKEDILRQTTQPPETTQQTTAATTSVHYADYADFSDFAFDTSQQGSQVGNILNRTNGAVTFSASYIFFSVPDSGIYRFLPAEETTEKLKGGAKNASSLNIMGDYLYYVDKDTHKLKKVILSGGDAITLAQDVKQAYGYNGILYCVTQSGSLFSLTADGKTRTELYTAGADKELAFVGISLSRVYFTVYDNFENEMCFVTVAQSGEDQQYFRAPSAGGELLSMQLENGFFYYYQLTDEGTYNLVRQKFGSDKEVVLLKNTSNTDYPVIYGNRLYYSEIKKGTCRAMELNMNSDKKKVMLTVSGAESSGTLSVGCGYQYIFLIGSKKDGGAKVYRASCIYTSSSADNMMDFKNGKWKY